MVSWVFEKVEEKHSDPRKGKVPNYVSKKILDPSGHKNQIYCNI